MVSQQGPEDGRETVAGGAAHGWVDHLRAGGTTPWARWRERPAAAGRSHGVLPGAQQLELLRRLNETGRPGPALVERVLRTPGAGRGEPELDLLGAGPARTYGRRPVDPADLPAAELLRVAVAVLADRLAAESPAGPSVAEADPAPVRLAQRALARVRRVRPAGVGRRAYRLGGDPWLTAYATAGLVAAGHPPGGRDPVVVLLAPDLPTMLGDAWTYRTCLDPVAPWPGWVRAAHRRAVEPGGALPPRADLVAMARAWAQGVGPARVHVVADPAASGEVLAELLGVPALPPAPRMSLVAGELARRVGPALDVLVTDEERPRLLRERLAPLLAAVDTGPPPRVPAELSEWVRTEAARRAEELVAGGYAVHGDPAAISAAPVAADGGGAAVDAADEDLLGVAIAALLRAEEGTA